MPWGINGNGAPVARRPAHRQPRVGGRANDADASMQVILPGLCDIERWMQTGASKLVTRRNPSWRDSAARPCFAMAMVRVRTQAVVAKGKTPHDLHGPFATRLMRWD